MFEAFFCDYFIPPPNFKGNMRFLIDERLKK